VVTLLPSHAHSSPVQAAYVPYQDSKLTMLLSSGLGGNSKTAVLVACSRY
jgi:hypothetical protein